MKRDITSARMGSAPQKASSQRRKSSPSRSAGGTLRTHRSNAKQGPPLMVPPKRDSDSSQKRGRRRNASGDMSATGKPANSGWSTPPMSPMSWYGGSQMTPTLSSRTSKAWEMSPRLCSRLPCVSRTPFGSPVEPDVYWRNASVSSAASGRRQPDSTPSGSASVATQRSAASSGACSKSASLMSWMKAVVSTTLARESRMMARSRGSVRSSRAGSGGYAGTATSPAYRQPKKPAMYSMPGG